MALDWWLLQQHKSGQHPPTLRFYTWSPVAISLGYHQRQWPAYWQALTWQGQPIELVRRPTGGRAVLHQGDLTYAIVASGFLGSRLEAYQTLSRFLLQGWQSLGINLQYGQAKRGYIHNPNCFGTATGADLIDRQGRKLIGSAQLRQADAILQHGSMRIFTNSALLAQVFNETYEPLFPAKEEFKDQIVEALTEAACRCFGIELSEEPLSEQEWQEVLSLSLSDREFPASPGQEDC